MQALAHLDVLVELVNGQPTTTSLDVAKHFRKFHKNVLRAIDGLDCSPEFNALNFEPVEYADPKGESRPMVRMTRDGFMFLCMGFTGKEAALLKEAYIGAFNRMEATLIGESVKAAPEIMPLIAQRWLTTFDQSGNQHTHLLPMDKCIMNTAEFIDHMSHLSEHDIPTPQLLQLTMKFMTQLSKRNINFAGFAV